MNQQFGLLSWCCCHTRPEQFSSTFLNLCYKALRQKGVQPSKCTQQSGRRVSLLTNIVLVSSAFKTKMRPEVKLSNNNITFQQTSYTPLHAERLTDSVLHNERQL